MLNYLSNYIKTRLICETEKKQPPLIITLNLFWVHQENEEHSNISLTKIATTPTNKTVFTRNIN